ncbi:hypothetical protein ACFL5F_03210 [Planctomycetota bacterium]
MSGNSLVLAGQKSRFSTPAIGQTVVRMPPSPMVLQTLMQTLANLNAKVDALATRPVQVVEVRPVEVSPVEVRHVEVKQVEVKPKENAPQQKVDRKSLWDIFD